MTRQNTPLLLCLLAVVLISGLAGVAPVQARSQPAPILFQAPTGDPTQEEMIPVQTATPDESGKVIHEVQPGQALWSIAIAYGSTIREIAILNGLDPENPVIYAGQKLVIKAGATPTATSDIQVSPTPTITRTPRPTSTRKPTGTPRPTHTATVTPTATPKPVFPQLQVLQTINRRSVGIGIIAVCALGLLLVAVSSLRKS